MKGIKPLIYLAVYKKIRETTCQQSRKRYEWQNMPKIQQVLPEQNTRERCNDFRKDSKESIDRSKYKFE